MTNKDKIYTKQELKEYNGGYSDGDVPCDVCGKPKNYPYYRTFDKVSDFRGDDEVDGNLCHDCYNKLKQQLKTK